MKARRKRRPQTLGVNMLLEEISPDLWLANGEPVSFHGFAYPTRCLVARLPDLGLWVWSPIDLTPQLQASIDRLGTVTHLVSPNRLHYLFLSQWRSAYPRAKIWGPSSTIRKMPDLAFAPALEYRPPDEWRGVFDQAWFRGSFALDEIVFFHIASGVVIVADLIQAFDERFMLEHWPWWFRPIARMAGITATDPKAPLDLRLSFLDRAAARRARDKILSWECEKVVIAHGQWPRQNGRAFLQRAFAWLDL